MTCTAAIMWWFDDAFWVDLVRHGLDQNHVIWFTKLDVDPAVKLKQGWKSINYVC